MGSDFFFYYYISLSGEAARKMKFAQNPDREEGRSQAFWSNYIIWFTNQDMLSNSVAANISVALDFKSLFPAHTTCPSYFVRELFDVLTQGQRLSHLECHELSREDWRVTHWQLSAEAESAHHFCLHLLANHLALPSCK